jgi:hypothetical protein
VISLVLKMTNTFLERLHQAIGFRYEPWMRRSLQTAILYEAKRIAESLLGSTAASRARPSPQVRNDVLITQARALIQSLSFVDAEQRQEILWKTATSQEPVDGDNAWKRLQLLDRQVPDLVVQLVPHVDPTKSQNEMVDALATNLFVSAAADCYFPGIFMVLTDTL